MKQKLAASIQSRDPGAVFDIVAGWPEFSAEGLPANVSMGFTKVEPANWRTIRDATNPVGGLALWGPPFTTSGRAKQLDAEPQRGLITFAIAECFTRASEAIARISPLPFVLASFGQLFEQWPKPIDGHKRWGIDIDHGWGMLFRGPGHDRLVSRRWLDFGPWRVEHLAEDTTFIQFHDLALTDAAEAWEQAKVGHERMGIGPIGGYIKGIDLDVISEVRGLYTAKTRTLEIVVAPGSSVSQQEMRVACALRLHQRDTKVATDRIDQIAYAFIDRRDAEAHLHELWLRELQCWYVDGKGKHRLDAEYRPTPTPPVWVLNLTGGPNALAL